ncbi:MAG: right-handed parallel beta-helix repeat-containing protein [Actinomycetota bacterium]|nr:right-handed parallel beta-helix repeat-containing protein [Actinomycetota bacterium]
MTKTFVWRVAATMAVAPVVVLGLAGCEPAVTCGSVLTEDTTLESDLLNCPGDGLVIGADDIEVRLAGHTVDGSLSEGSAGIRVDGRAGALIRGPGLVTDFADGVRLEDADGNRVRELTATGNAFGIRLVRADGSRIVANDARDNLEFGGDGHGPLGIPRGGVLLEGSNRNLVEGELVFQNAGGPGVALVQSRENRVLGNVAVGSDAPNIWLRESHRNVVAGNQSTGSNVVAIELRASNDNLVEDNVASDNESEGITVWRGSARNIVRFNSAADNHNVGIVVNDAVGTVVRGNVTSDNDRFADGIEVRAAASGTVVRENTSNGNGDDGIDVDSPSTRLVDNVANGNGDLGIEAVPGVVDGGGNRASGNGNPAQCTGVVCS